MALNFKGSAAERIYTADEFLGVDFTTEPSKVISKRSPEAKNMIINKNGYVEKRTGCRRVLESTGNINGIFEYVCAENDTTYHFIHIGTSLYKFTPGADGGMTLGEAVLTGLGDKKSRGFTFGGALYIIGAGYIKIGYDDFTKSLCCGFVKNAFTVGDEASAPTIISGRTLAGRLDGTAHEYVADNAYKKIEFAGGHYRFHAQYGSKLYIAPPEYANKVRVQSVYFAPSYIGAYFRVGEREYSIETDNIGLYVNLNRTTLSVDEDYHCAPYVIVQYNNFVYSPTVVTQRIPISETEIGGYAVDMSGQRTTDYVKYTGEVLEGVNLASGVRRIEFYYNSAEHCNSADALRCFLTNEAGHITGIWVDGQLVQTYRNVDGTDGAEAVRCVGASEVEIDKSRIGMGEHIITVELVLAREHDTIDECSIYALYGGGSDTRVFVSGNKKYKSRDFASGLFDASYFSDLQYTDVGSEESAIVGYHKLYGNLIIVKDGVGKDSAQYLRSFSLGTDALGTATAVFAVKQGNISYGAANASSFKNIGGAPLYLGHDGVFAISGTAVENQNNTSCVSQMINGRLKKESGFDSAVCAQLGGKYYMFFDTHAYVCDVESGFEWFYFDSLPPVRCVWTLGETMYFGTGEGKVYRFMAEDEKNAYYDDVGADGSVTNARTIEAVWELGATTLGEYANYKTVRNCYITCMPHKRSSVKVYYNTNEDYRDWVLGENIDLFSFDDVDFDRFTFRTIAAPFVFVTGVKVKNVYVFGLRLVNDTPGEPFGFLAVTVKYRTGKYVK